MQGLSDFFSAFLGGFARIFIASFILWMVGVIVILFMELFNQEEFQFRGYVRKIWKTLLLSFQIAAYGSIAVGLFYLFRAEKGEYLIYSLVMVDGILLSILYFYLQRSFGIVNTKKNSQETMKRK